MRSAIAPVINAGVMTANIIWYTAKARCGVVVAYTSLGACPTPRKPQNSRPPIRPPTSSPNASVYPISTHRTVTSPRAKNDCMIVPSTFLARTSPP
jgi:hypothetical protein